MDGNVVTTAPKIVNGINVDDLFALIEGVKKDPAKGITCWRVATAWQAGVQPQRGRGLRHRRRGGAAALYDRHRRALQLGGSNRFANPQEYLIAALNACMTVGYVAQCAVHGIMLESLAIETEGEIDLRGFLGIDPEVSNGYDSLRYTVRIKGSGTKEQFAEIHEAVMATSPNFYNLSRPVALKPTLVVE